MIVDMTDVTSSAAWSFGHMVSHRFVNQPGSKTTDSAAIVTIEVTPHRLIMVRDCRVLTENQSRVRTNAPVVSNPTCIR
jgi:hypothetical protein